MRRDDDDANDFWGFQAAVEQCARGHCRFGCSTYEYMTVHNVVRRAVMESAPARSGSRSASRKSSAVVVIAQNDIAEIKVRKQSSNLLAQQLQQQLLLQQQQQQRIVRRDQVFCLHPC